MREPVWANGLAEVKIKRENLKRENRWAMDWQWLIGSIELGGSIELDGSIGLDGSSKPDGGRALELVENGQFGEENWEVISGDTLGDAGEQRSKADLEEGNLDCLDVMVSHEGFGPVVMTTLGSWMAWRSLAARQSLVA